MGYGYSEYRKDSHAPLRNKEVSGKENLSKYEAKEEKRKAGKEPKEKLLLENTYGVVNLGISDKKEKEKKGKNEKQERLVTVSGMREDRGGNPRDAEFLRETGAVTMKPYNRRGFTNSHDKKMSAMGLRVLPSQTGERVAAQLEHLAEKEELGAIRQMLPFLAGKEERESIKLLQEKRRKEGVLDMEQEKYLELLLNNRMHRQQKKKELVESLNQIIRNKEKQEGKEEKKRSKSADILWETLNAQLDGEDAAEKAGDEEEGKAAGKKKNRNKKQGGPQEEKNESS